MAKAKKPVKRAVKKRNVRPINFTKKVQKVIDSQVERKEYVIALSNVTLPTASGGGNPISIPVLPLLQHGTNQEARVGQQIKITKGYVKGFVNLLPYNAITNPNTTPIMVRLILASCKLTNSSTLSSTAIGTNLFETGADTVGVQGNMLDMMLPVNKDAWTVHGEKVFELGATYASATGPVTTGGYYDNSKMILPFKFEIGKYFKQQLKYSDDSSSTNAFYPYNRNCWLILQPVSADGTSAGGYVMAEVHYNIHIEYSDL